MHDRLDVTCEETCNTSSQDANGRHEAMQHIPQQRWHTKIQIAMPIPAKNVSSGAKQHTSTLFFLAHEAARGVSKYGLSEPRLKWAMLAAHAPMS